MLVATYTVKAGDTLRQAFPMDLFQNGKYHIDVVGPNGFYRSFRGVSTDPSSLQVRATYESKATSHTGNVEVTLGNNSTKSMNVEIYDNSYKTGNRTVQLAAGVETSVVLNLSNQHGWYDFIVKETGAKTESHYAGRVETGRSSFSDPLMGDVV